VEWWIRLNIFALDTNPQKCAEWHCDKHVVKMILESAQMICTTHHLHPRIKQYYEIPYKCTHTFHPCTKWVRESLDNYLWLFELISSLNNEYKKRFNHVQNHKSFDAVKTLPLPNIKSIGLTPFAQAMPDEFKQTSNPCENYKLYYKLGKKDILKYNHSEMPNWLKEG